MARIGFAIALDPGARGVLSSGLSRVRVARRGGTADDLDGLGVRVCS